jgi:hypothetical protein
MIKKILSYRHIFLIVMGIIVVGTAIIVGMNAFTSNSGQSNRDAVIADLTNLATLAQDYYLKPASQHGGNNSFIGWKVPEEIDTTGNGTYTAVISEQSVEVTGTGTEKGNDGIFPVKVTMTIGPERIIGTKVKN